MYRKVTKSQVKKELAKLKHGETLGIIFLPSKANINSYWVHRLLIEYDMYEERFTLDGEVSTFEQDINTFKYYNCNTELGKNIHFYIKDDK